MTNFSLPVRFKQFHKKYHNRSFTLLDVGCGNHSATLFGRFFPKCAYHGLDKQQYNNDTKDIALMKRFFQIDLSSSDLGQIPNSAFDLINMAHVIEHLLNGIDVISQLCAKVKPGGNIYIEYPGPRSLSLPSAEGTLNFCDDTTHVRLYNIVDICNVLLQNGFVIKKAGTLYDPYRILLSPIRVLQNLIRLGLGKKIKAQGLWYVFGFCDYVYAEKKPTHVLT